ncbi:hypothetical protein NN561_002089 [Cricetulus griseus]
MRKRRASASSSSSSSGAAAVAAALLPELAQGRTPPRPHRRRRLSPLPSVRRAAGRDSQARLGLECPRIHSDPRPHSRRSPGSPRLGARACACAYARAPASQSAGARARGPRDAAAPRTRGGGGLGAAQRGTGAGTRAGTGAEEAPLRARARGRLWTLGRSGYRSSQALLLRAPGFAGDPGLLRRGWRSESGDKRRRNGESVRVRDSPKAG